MNPRPMLRWILLCAGVLSADALRADETSDTINDLKRQIQRLDEKVRALEGERRAREESAAAAKSGPRVSLGGGVTITSADTNFVIGLHGYVQVDSRTFLQSGAAPGADGFVLRRARPIISGTVFHDFEFRLMPDFGGSSPVIYDAYVNYQFRPEAQLQIGKFKPPIGLERLQSARDLAFNERSLATDLVPNRDLGAEWHGDLFDGRLSYAAGIFNGVADLGNSGNGDFDNNKEFAGRVFVQPTKTAALAALRGLGFGVSGSFGDQATAVGLPGGYTSDGQQKFFTYTNGVAAAGAHWRLSPQGTCYWGPFGLMGEYVISDQRVRKGDASADAQNTAWELTGGWVLTGEAASFDGVTPRRPFAPLKGQWGAWELNARYAELRVDGDAFPAFADPRASAGSASAWAVGVSWWLNRNVRFQTSVSRTTFSGGRAGAGGTVADRKAEEGLFTRAQLAF